MATTFDVIFLGQLGIWDVDESNITVDRTQFNPPEEAWSGGAADMNGLTFGSATDPLGTDENIQSFSPGTTGYTDGTSNAYDSNDTTTNDTFAIDGGADQVLDSVIAVDGTITYQDVKLLKIVL